MPAVAWSVGHHDVELLRDLCEAGETRGINPGEIMILHIRKLPLDMIQYLYAVIIKRGIKEADIFASSAWSGVGHLRMRRREQWDQCEANLLQHTVDDGGWACRLAFEAVTLGLPLPTLQHLLEQLDAIAPAWAPTIIDAVFCDMEQRASSAFSSFNEDHAVALTYAVAIWHGGDVWLPHSNTWGERLNIILPLNPLWCQFMVPVHTMIQARRRQLCVWHRRRTLLLLRRLRDCHRAAPRSKI